MYGDKNGNKGRGYYYWWVKKHGKKTADQMQLKYNEKLSNREISDGTRRKMRINAIKRIEKQKLNGGQLSPIYNPAGCQYFNKLMEQTGTHIQHAENGGEYHIKGLGYWVDGYDKENNIVYEYDEKSHFDVNGKLKEKDIRRQKEIEDYFNNIGHKNKCKFIRIKENEE